MTLGDEIIEMLEEGYGVHLYWEPDLSGNTDHDRLVVDVSRGGESVEYKFFRSHFFTPPTDLILRALQDIKEKF